jgi:FtsH-binding integral membrane protein
MGPMMLNLQIYGGLAMFMMYILVDVQVEIEASESGRRDAVSGALDLFVDAVAIFVRLVIILTRNKKEERRRDRN